MFTLDSVPMSLTRIHALSCSLLASHAFGWNPVSYSACRVLPSVADMLWLCSSDRVTSLFLAKRRSLVS